ncbi:MAG: hypothetical protein NTY74_09815 [Ignavibacteriae bacterium]|nr:hypothetical protein [Ignavibacteriota bacterium]
MQIGMKRFAISIILLLVFCANGYSQDKDTLSKTISIKDTVKIPFNHNKILKKQTLSSFSDTTGIDFHIWSDKRNLAELLNTKSGYFVHTFGTGGRSLINYNGSSGVGVFRNGMQINDLFTGTFDVENLSINEIDEVEEVSTSLSFMYGLNTQGKAINVLDKDYFQPNLFTQFRYSQDRDGALFADVYMNFPVSRKFNFILGINNHGTEGHYQNSDFALWRGRFQFNYYPTDRINFKLSYYINKLQRGLNEGLVSTTKDTLMNINLATPNNPDSYEKVLNQYSDFKITGKFLRDSLSLTNITVFTQNSFRLYRDEENRTTKNGIFIGKDFHSIQYGFDVNQSLNIVPFKLSQIKLIAGLKGLYNLYNYDKTTIYEQDSVMGQRYFDFNSVDIYSRLDLMLKDVLISGAIKSQRFNNSYNFMFGADIKYNIDFNKETRLVLKGGTNNTTVGYDFESLFYNEYYGRYENNYNSSRQQYYEGGFSFNYRNVYFNYLNYYSSQFSQFSMINANYSAGINLENYQFDLNVNTSDKSNYINVSTLSFGNNNPVRLYPSSYITLDVSYKDVLFKNKLKLRTGFLAKYISDKPEVTYNQLSNMMEYNPNYAGFDNFDLDLYFGARIGKANINITLANILNSLFYNTSIYPFDDRNGLLRTISRFTITWDFLN